MKNKIKQLARSRGLENAILISILLFLYNLVFPMHDTLMLAVINELLVFLSIFFLYYYIIRFLNAKVDSPLTLILNAGILAALIFFIVSIANTILGSSNKNEQIGFFNSLFAVLLAFVFIGSVVYIFSTFRELFYLRQKRDPSAFFNSMLVFFALTFFSNLLIFFDPSFDYPKDAFYVVTIVLIFLNALRISWIAFLTKRQKYYLLLISIILSILFAINFMTFTENSIMTKVIYSFSPGLLSFLCLTMIYGTINFGVIFFTTLFHLPTAEAFDRKAAEVSSLMDLTKLITQVFDFKELAETVTSITSKVCNSDSSWLVLKKGKTLELSSVNNIGYVEADTITNNLLGTGQNDFDSIAIIQFDSFNNNSVNDKKFKSIAIAPLKVQKIINGYLFAARHREGNFDLDDKKAVQAFADYAAVALENAQLIGESIEKERLEKELDVARDIQRKILPHSIPTSEKLEISALFVPAFEVGGDYYDFFELDNDRIGFVIADVSGKGISAAFIMAEVKGIFESLSKLVVNPKELLAQVNSTLRNSLDKRNFVTAVYGIVNKKTGKLNFARAGHTPIMICSGSTIKNYRPAGIGLGLDTNINFASSIKELEIDLNNNDIILCYSDGIPEAKNDKEEDFGFERLESIVLKYRDEKLDFISEAVMKELSLFSKNHSQHDDITLVIFKWKNN